MHMQLVCISSAYPHISSAYPHISSAFRLHSLFGGLGLSASLHILTFRLHILTFHLHFVCIHGLFLSASLRLRENVWEKGWEQGKASVGVCVVGVVGVWRGHEKQPFKALLARVHHFQVHGRQLRHRFNALRGDFLFTEHFLYQVVKAVTVKLLEVIPIQTWHRHTCARGRVCTRGDGEGGREGGMCV